MPTTYHLWLQPSGNVCNFFEKIIADLSATYAGPFFEPHVTLLSSLPGTEEEIVNRVSQFGGLLQPFDLLLTESAFGEEYFYCVFLKVQKTPAILHAHELARRLFKKNSSSYLPHLSLLYGHYSNEQKTRIAATLPENMPHGFAVEKVILIRARSENPQDWKPILTVPLKT